MSVCPNKRSTDRRVLDSKGQRELTLDKECLFIIPRIKNRNTIHFVFCSQLRHMAKVACDIITEGFILGWETYSAMIINRLHISNLFVSFCQYMLLLFGSNSEQYDFIRKANLGEFPILYSQYYCEKCGSKMCVSPDCFTVQISISPDKYFPSTIYLLVVRHFEIHCE